jgi:hypothetical protein
MGDDEPPPGQTISRALAGIGVLGMFVWFFSGSFCLGASLALVGSVVAFAYLAKQKEARELARRGRLEAQMPPVVRSADETLRPHRWPLEEPYRLSVVELAAPGERADPGKRTPALVRIQLTRILIVPAGDAGSWEPPAVIPAGDIEKIELTNASAVLVCRTAAYAFVPASYADRERLEWELAVRFPEAVERGLPG